MRRPADFASRAHTLVRIERHVPDTALKGAGKGTWSTVDDEWVAIEDARPSRADRLADGFEISRRPAKVEMRYRMDVLPGMRLVEADTGRARKIIAGPAELERGQTVEFMVEDWIA